jgi:hypothetical protein
MVGPFNDRGITAGNSTYSKVAVQWLNQALCSYESLCLVDSEVLPNRNLRVAAKRLGHMLKTRPANDTFGFCRHTSQRLKKPKDPFFANARTDRATIIQTLFILKNEIKKTTLAA